MTQTADDKMPAEEQVIGEIEAFEAAYGYDASYMKALWSRSPQAMMLFHAVRPMAAFHRELPAEAHFTAAITVMQLEDCRGCLALNFKLAREAGVSDDILAALAESPQQLPAILQDVREHTRACLGTGPVNEATAKRIEARFGVAAFAELALCIVGVRMYPGMKRALLKLQDCGVPQVR